MSKLIQEAVALKISTCGETVQNTVVDILANGEINKRVDAVTKAIAKVEQLEKDFKKIDGKCDQVTFVDGQRKEAMSEGRFNEIKKAKEKLDNLTSALNAALETNTQEAYNKLNGLLKANDSTGSDKNTSGPKTESQA